MAKGTLKQGMRMGRATRPSRESRPRQFRGERAKTRTQSNPTVTDVELSTAVSAAEASGLPVSEYLVRITKKRREGN
jgi:hypothetical protein